MADWDKVTDGNRNVYSVLTPLPTRQKPMPITHMRRVRHGRVGSSALSPTPAAKRTSSVGVLDSSEESQSVWETN